MRCSRQRAGRLRRGCRLAIAAGSANALGMGEIVLIRHGQANRHANDEAGYDRLSDLGKRQAEWLGEWLARREKAFDRVLSGSLKRHVATAEAMGLDAPDIDGRLNEMDYFNLGAALQDRHGVPMPESPESYAAHVVQVMEAWHRAEIEGNESFASFEARVAAVLDEAARPGVRVLAVTSGGVIGMVVRHLLELDPRQLARILLPIFNTSVHRIHVTPHGAYLAGFNAIPHLERDDRAHARTHY